MALALLSGCASYPTLLQVTRERVAGKDHRDDLSVPYKITDRDILNYTDRIKTALAKKFDTASLARYGSSSTQLTLSSLAGAATTAGWSASTASGLGIGAASVFGLGQIIDAKGHAQAYEQAFTAVQSAEATYYFHQLGMGFKKDGAKYVVDLSQVSSAATNNLPSSDKLTPDGETLLYRTCKVLRVLDDVLASKIPDLQDLKDAKGDTSGNSTTPLKGGDATPTAPNDNAHHHNHQTGGGDSGGSRVGAGSNQNRGSSISNSAPTAEITVEPVTGMTVQRVKYPDGSIKIIPLENGKAGSNHGDGSNPAPKVEQKPVETGSGSSTPVVNTPPSEEITVDPSTGKTVKRIKNADGTMTVVPLTK